VIDLLAHHPGAADRPASSLVDDHPRSGLILGEDGWRSIRAPTSRLISSSPTPDSPLKTAARTPRSAVAGMSSGSNQRSEVARRSIHPAAKPRRVRLAAHQRLER